MRQNGPRYYDPTNIALHNQFIPREHLKTQKYVEDIEKSWKYVLFWIFYFAQIDYLKFSRHVSTSVLSSSSLHDSDHVICMYRVFFINGPKVIAYCSKN